MVKYFLLTLLLGFQTGLAQTVTKSEVPKWVVQRSATDQQITDSSSPHHYFLLDLQHHLPQESFYVHEVIRLLNSEGVQNMSGVQVTFDPTFQQLYFHQLRLVRESEVIDQLPETQFELIRRETSMDRSQYDGSVTAVANLKDVRAGDVLEYAYTIVGINPINKGHYSSIFYQQFTQPINQVYQRVIAAKPLNIQIANNGREPEVEQKSGEHRYTWEFSARQIFLFDNNVPDWYQPRKAAEYTTFQEWEEVVNWALPLYTLPSSEVSQIAQSMKITASSQILNLIRSVQDEVRYLGVESGIGAYQPNPPSRVWGQKYGDCKDKSLLLVASLRARGVDSWPLLVNSSSFGPDASRIQPSHRAFDHCVVAFDFNSQRYFVDPTISNQGGSLDIMAFPAYGHGLLIKPGQTELITLPTKGFAETRVKEVFTNREIGGAATLKVRTEYLGARADEIRSAFSRNSTEVIQKEYLGFYSALYPDIEVAGELKFYDYDRSSTNEVIVEESYRIPSFWVEKEGLLYTEIYPLVLESAVNYPKSPGRSMPYATGRPFYYYQISEIDLPEEWTIEPQNEVVLGDGFEFRFTTSGRYNSRTAVVDFMYRLDTSVIDGTSVPVFLQNHEKVKENFSFYLSYNQAMLQQAEGLSWASLLLFLIGFAVAAYFAVVTNQRFDPEPWQYAEDTPIGGWLILPAIGLILTPFRMVFQLVNSEFFSNAVWVGLGTMEHALQLKLLVATELVVNGFLIVFSVFVIFQFFQRRTSVIKLVTVFYIANIVVQVVDVFFTVFYLGEMAEVEMRESVLGIFRVIVAAAIWIPYFNISERAKSTFCKTYAPRAAQHPYEKRDFFGQVVSDSPKSGDDSEVKPNGEA